MTSETTALQAEMNNLQAVNDNLQAKLAALDIALSMMKDLPRSVWSQVRTVEQLQSFLSLFDRDPTLSDLTDSEFDDALVEASNPNIFLFVLHSVPPTPTGMKQMLSHSADYMYDEKYEPWKRSLIWSWFCESAENLSNDSQQELNAILNEMSTIQAQMMPAC
jgi:hypothetical protein